MENTYIIKIKCENCGYTSKTSLPIGTTTKGSYRCDYCGCDDAAFDGIPEYIKEIEKLKRANL